jgi:hypothetical protein
MSASTPVIVGAIARRAEARKETPPADAEDAIEKLNDKITKENDRARQGELLSVSVAMAERHSARTVCDVFTTAGYNADVVETGFMDNWDEWVCRFLVPVRWTS